MQLITCSTPLWFGVTKIIIQLIFALVTLLVAFFSYKVYKLSRQRPTFLFGLGFIALSSAYFIEALFNYLLLQGVQTQHLFPAAIGVAQPLQLSIFVVSLQMLLMITGLSLLSYVTLKERGAKIFLLILSMSLVGIVMSAHVGLTFYIITSIFLLFITAQYFQRHARKPTKNSLMVFMGFGLLFLGNVQLAFAQSLSLLYISGHFISLFGYLLLLVNLLRVVKR
ncbi:hypothetical protein K9M74_04450 [Candidatus Woesearchaeota archaeon]|nr:hypothetical protein [Candidatus Woesearchaeota archaeon]